MMIRSGVTTTASSSVMYDSIISMGPTEPLQLYYDRLSRASQVKFKASAAAATCDVHTVTARRPRVTLYSFTATALSQPIAPATAQRIGLNSGFPAAASDRRIGPGRWGRSYDHLAAASAGAEPVQILGP